MKIKEIINLAKDQGIKLNSMQATKIQKIQNICESNHFVNNRFRELKNAGFCVTQNPMKTGYGVGSCMKKVNNEIRVRISANWSGGFANYADCVHI